MFYRNLLLLAGAATILAPVSGALACTMEPPSSPEIEIEIEFEDYDGIRDRVFYKIQIEIEVEPPTQNTQCQCGVGFGNSNFSAPDSFEVIAAAVAIKNDDDDSEFELTPFSGFASDAGVAKAIAGLPGLNSGAQSYGLSAAVDPFNLPPLGPEDRLVLGFIIEFAPGDFDLVNGNVIQFAAGSTEPGHPLALLNSVQPTLNLPPFQLYACDTNYDNLCDVRDLNGILALGPINVGVPRTDATEIFDIIGDDIIDAQDVTEWLALAAELNGLPSPYRRGDANLNGAVDQQDAFIWYSNRGTASLFWDDGNFNGDGFVNARDFLIWRSNRSR